MTSLIIPEDLLKKPASRFLLTGATAKLGQTLHELSEQYGTADWFLLVQLAPRSFIGCRFSSLRRWEKQQGMLPTRDIFLRDLRGSPLTPTAIVEDTSELEEARTLAQQHPEGMVVVLWEASDVVCGVLSLDSMPLPWLADREQDQDLIPAPQGFFPAYAQPDEISRAQIDNYQDVDLKLVDTPAGQREEPATVSAHNDQKKQKEKTKGKVRAKIHTARTSFKDFYVRARLPVVLGVIGFLLFTLYPWIKNMSEELKPIFNPDPMTGEWNVAVAAFSILPDSPVSQKDVDYISEVYFNKLKDEIEGLKSETGLGIQLLGPTAVGAMSGDKEEDRNESAAALAKKIKADVILFGSIGKKGEMVILTPEFYVDPRNMQEAQEMIGQHVMGEGISISVGTGDLPNQANLNRELARRSQILALVTKGLSYYSTNYNEDALTLFHSANDDKLWEVNTGREVVYLFEGNAGTRTNQLDQAEKAYRAASSLDPEYARAYVGLGNIFYARSLPAAGKKELDDEKIKISLDFYDKALAAKNQLPSADIAARVNFGKGSVYLAQWLYGEETLPLANECFKKVLEAYDDGKNGRIQILASEVHDRLGIIARRNKEYETAITEFEASRVLAPNPQRRGTILVTLYDLYNRAGKPEDASSACQKAIAEFQQAMILTSQTDRDAYFSSQISLCYERLGDVNKARSALEDAIHLDPTKHPTWENRLATLQALATPLP